jgi:hypothetical protein
MLIPAVQEAKMTVRTITVTIPEMLFLQLEAAARSSAQSVDVVVAQSLERTIPPHLAALLPNALQAELDAMEHLSDAALHAIADRVAPSKRGIQMDDLIALKQAGAIAPEQQEQLTALMVRKAHAFVLLKSRGHTPPLIAQLPVPTA